MGKAVGAVGRGGARVAGRGSCAVGGSTSSERRPKCDKLGGVVRVLSTSGMRERGLDGGLARSGLAGGRGGVDVRIGGADVRIGGVDVRIGGVATGRAAGIGRGAGDICGEPRAMVTSSWLGSITARVVSSSGGTEALLVGMSIMVGSLSTATSTSGGGADARL